jgi:hypothetical protein
MSAPENPGDILGCPHPPIDAHPPLPLFRSALSTSLRARRPQPLGHRELSPLGPRRHIRRGPRQKPRRQRTPKPRHPPASHTQPAPNRAPETPNLKKAKTIRMVRRLRQIHHRPNAIALGLFGRTLVGPRTNGRVHSRAFASLTLPCCLRGICQWSTLCHSLRFPSGVEGLKSLVPYGTAVQVAFKGTSSFA